MKLAIRILESSRQGFTIVELLIVVVVIAILAAITIVSYNGITSQATESTLKSDLRTAATTLELDKTTAGTYPVDAGVVNSGQGLKVSGGNTLTYIPKPYGYCVTASNSSTSTVYELRSNTGGIAKGDCRVAVSTLAGSGIAGFADGAGTSAQFNAPMGITIGSTGVLFVADSGNNRIRAITSSGQVSTYAGTGVGGAADGVAATAQFRSPAGVSVTPSGTILVADRWNNRIREISSTSVVSTLAGATESGHIDGPTALSRFNIPLNMAVASTGTVYVADTSNRRIREISSAGMVTTLAGSGSIGRANGIGVAAQFNWPYDIAINHEGVLYVSDTYNNRIRKITPAGEVTTFAGGDEGFMDGTGTGAQFSAPRSIAFGLDGMLYVADAGNNRIRKITSTGIVTTVAGTASAGYEDGPGDGAKFSGLRGIVVDNAGTIYVTEEGNNRIRKIVQ